MMNFSRAFLIPAAIALAMPHAGFAQGKPADSIVTTYSFYTGQAFLDLSKRNQKLYVSGLSDAYNEAYRNGYNQKGVVQCTQGRDDKDLAELFRIWLQGRPYRLTEPAPRLFADAMKETCG